MTDAFEQRLHRALVGEAGRAPLTHREWRPLESPVQSPSASRVARFAATAALVGLIVGTGVIMWAVRDDDSIRSIATPPDGIEVPMVPASANGMLAAPGDALVKPGSVYAFTLGDRRFGVSESMWWSGIVGDTVATSVCAMPDTGGAMCTTAQPGPWIMDVAEESASGNVYVGGLPDNAAYVTLTVGGREYWQDPVRDLALFPLAVAERPASATVVLSTGEVIDLTADRSDASNVPGAVVDEYPSHSLVGARQVMYSVGQACLANADLPDPRGSIPPGTDVDAVWDECVVLADAAVRGFLRTAEAQQPDTPAMPIGAPPSQPTG